MSPCSAASVTVATTHAPRIEPGTRPTMIQPMPAPVERVELVTQHRDRDRDAEQHRGRRQRLGDDEREDRHSHEVHAEPDPALDRGAHERGDHGKAHGGDGSVHGGGRSIRGRTARRPYTVARDPPVLRPHLRLPDERARLGTARGPARRGGDGTGDRSRRCRRGRAQHVLHPRERRQQALRPPRAPEDAEGGATRSSDRGRRLPRAEGSRSGAREGAARRRRVRHPQPRPRARLARTGAGRRPARRNPRGARGLPVGAARAPRGRPLGLGDDPDRLRQLVCVLHRARGARP